MLDEKTLSAVARQVMRFAEGKLGQTADAEDLSQEILLHLCETDLSAVENLGAFVSTVCRYTWAKYLRKNKPAWRALTLTGDLPETEDGETPEELAIRRETAERLGREVRYLSGVRREIVLAKYYDGRSAEDIGRRLGLSPSTVRWHLSEIRRGLKERLSMREEVYRPLRLKIGYSGGMANPVYAALSDDILMQNLCLAARDPVTVEDAARILGVAAAYLEDKLERLAGADYMTKTGNRYRTNFFIAGADFILAQTKYRKKTAPALFDITWTAFGRAYPKLTKAVDFARFSENDVKTTLFAWFVFRVTGAADSAVIESLHLQHAKPKRPDGTCHWLNARLDGAEVRRTWRETLPEDEAETLFAYMNDTAAYGIKTSGLDGGTVMQFDVPVLGGFRPFLNEREVEAILQAAAGVPMTKYDRERFVLLIQRGWAAVEGDAPRLLFPWLSAAEKRAVEEIFAEAEDTLDRDALFRLHAGYAEAVDPYIPKSVSPNERAHVKTSYDPLAAVLREAVIQKAVHAPDTKAAGTIGWDN